MLHKVFPMQKKFIFIYLLLIFLVLPSCKMGGRKIRLGILPFIDALPLVVADSEGIFKQEGVDVELIFFNSTLEQDEALMSGSLDGALNDPINFFRLIKNGINAKIVCETYHTTSHSLMFGLMAAPYCGIRTVKDIRDEQVAISWGTINEFILDQIIASEGIPSGRITKLEIKAMPVRYQMLISGSIRMALLPEPLVSKGLKDGAHLIADDRVLDAMATVIIFKSAFLEENKSAIKKFISSYNKSVKIVNSFPEKYREIMVTKLRLPSDIKETFKIPHFREAVLPAEKDVLTVYYWMKKNGMISIPVDYKKLVWTR